MDGSRIRLPASDASPWRKLALRVGLAVGTLLYVAVVVWLARDGYVDDAGDGVSFLDGLYYATVSVTTTGYGDITPVTDWARAVTIVFITPARVFFLVLLVGATVEILTTQTLMRLRVDRWRHRLKDHVIIVGFGTKGRTAAGTLRRQGVAPSRIVVVDPDPDRVGDASREGLTAVHGDGRRADVLEEAGVARARQVVVAVDQDDAAVLVTLTVREHNREAVLVAAAREDENARLLHDAGATSVVRTASAAGRMLGLASHSPQLVAVLEDLTTIGEGIDLVERPVEESECGEAGSVLAGSSVVAVIRDERTFRWDDPEVRILRHDDRLVCLKSHA
jgi:voltage-gated potassium channel